MISVELTVAYLEITRPVNCAITFLSVLVGAWIGKTIGFSGTLIGAGLIGAAVCAFGNIVNDLKDIEIDRTNNPARPLPSGRIKPRHAVVMAVLFSVISCAGALFLGLAAFLVVVLALALLFLYSALLKKTVAGNVTVASIAGLSFVFGGIVASNGGCIVPALFSLFIHTPREIIKDVIDMNGDRKAGARTLPIIAGPVAAYNASAVCLGLLCLMLPLPFLWGLLNTAYIVIILAVGYPLLFYVIYRLLRRPDANGLPLISNLIKASMAAGLVAMIVPW